IAIRHFNCHDEFILNVDDIQLTAGAKDGGERHLEGYKVMCTSIDGEPIFNTNTVHPFCQVATDALVEGEHYICKVAAIYSTGMSDWTEAEWEYESCEHYAGTVNGVTVEGNTISWDYPGGGPVPPVPGEGDTFSVDFEDSQIPAGWTTIDGGSPAGYGWQLASAKIGAGNGHNASNDCVLSQSYDNNYGIVYPDNYLVTPQVTLTNGSTFSFYACAQDANYAAEHFGVFVSDNGTSGWTMVNEWTIGQKGERYEGTRGMRDQSAWTLYSVDLSAFAGQKYIAIRHFNCSDMFYLDVDDIALTIGAKSNRDVVHFNGYVTDPGAMANGADASWTKGSQSTWGPNVNNASGYKLGDSFTLTAATTINEIEVYGYQTGSSTTSTFTGLYAQIFNGNPMSGGTAIWGSETTNIMTATSFTNCYRGSDGETTATTRPIMAITASNLSIDLEAGTYWLVYSLEGTGTSGPWGAPQAEPGIGNTGNGVQLTTTGWQNLVDSGAGTTYGCAMKISGGSGGPVPPTPSGDILGAMIFVDGEWEAFVPVPTNTYTYEGEGSEVCVRIVYNGTADLPSNNYYYAMSCEECEALIPGSGSCEPGA
ncbi:MAG: choice-of-anchor J domain-containing protein, partial [Muribaculaceae bacterium]|nr:choice-of-anchor J domain-containing protein [Muribaculaceae bacterium]